MKPLDPLLLGRPVRVIETVAADLARAVAQCLGHNGSRQIEVRVSNESLAPEASQAAVKAIDITLDPRTVVAHMAVRYGLSAQELTSPLGTSSTEQRIHAQMCRALVRTVEQFLEELGRATGLDAASPVPQTPQESGLRWEWRAEVGIGEDPAHSLVIALSDEWSRRLETCLAARRRQMLRHSKPSTAASEPVLHVDLAAQLLELTITAAELQALRPGAVIPIVMGRTTALLNGSPMLSATVAEHQGKLHLTAFENLE